MEFDIEKFKEEAKKLGIRMVVLFGSQAAGNAREDSDYDIAVLTMEDKHIGKDMDNYNEIFFFLCDIFKIPDYKFDLTNLNSDSVSPLLEYSVFFGGKLIYGNKTLFNERKARAYMNYVDSAPMLEFEKKVSLKKHAFIKQFLHNL